MATYTPPAEVAQNAREALAQRDLKPVSQRGMTAVGLARAQQLSERQPVSIDVIRRMVSYFARHEVDKTGSTWDDWGKGRQAWNGWGGDAGRDWAERILKEYEQMNDETKAARRHSESDMKMIRKLRQTMKTGLQLVADLGDDGVDDDMTDGGEYGVNNPVPPAVASIEVKQDMTEHNALLKESYLAIVSEAGKFTQGLDGAHYIPAEQNGFSASGLVCRNCVFWDMTNGGCEIVDGMIEPGAICKLWIIPAELITSAEPMEPMESEDDSAGVEIEIEVAAVADRNTTPAQREEMPAGDFVIPESRNFPVVTPSDIPAAVSSWGRYRGPLTFETFKRRIIRLAQRKGPEFVDALPQAWIDELNAKTNALMELLTRD